MISGFLIAGNSIERWGSLSQIDWRAFYLRRFARIAPGLKVVIACLSVGHFLGLKDYAIDKPGQNLWGAISSTLFMHLNWYQAQPRLKKQSRVTTYPV